MDTQVRRRAGRWAPSLLVAVAAVAIFAAGPTDTLAVVVLVVLLGFALALSPLIFPRSTTDAAAQRLAGTHTLVYWRPGCSYCMRLRMALGPRAKRAVWIDVSRDPAASARVKAANDGDETVPTVFVQGEAHTNPTAAWVRATL